MRTNSNRFKINLVTLAVASALTAWGMSRVQAQTSVGGCDTYAPTQGQTVTCTTAGTNPGSIGIQAPTNTSVNNVTVNIQPGVILNVNGSTIGLGNTSTVTNKGTLNTRTFFNGYGVSSGVNGRSGGGGNIFINDSTGSIITAGGNAAGMFVNSALAGSAGNSITNLGAITTSGNDADGIRLISNANQVVTNIITNLGAGSIQTSGSNAHGVSAINSSNVVQIINAGSIVANGTASHGVYAKGAINLAVNNVISSSNGSAIYIDPTTTNAAANTVVLQSSANIVGSIVFDTAKLSEKLIFDGIAASDFNNIITGLNDIEVVNSGDVRMTAASYDFGNSEIAIESGSVLTIEGNISGTGSLTKIGMGELALSGPNTYSGNTVVAEGVLAVLSDNALGSGKLIIGSFRQNPGTQAVLSGGVSVSNAIQMGQAVSSTDIAVISSYEGNNVLSGDIELQSSAQIFTDVLTENRLTISGAIDATVGGTQYLEADGADGKLVLSGGIGQNNPLGSVLLEGLVQLAANITTSGSQYLNEIALSSDVVLRGGEIFLTGSLNGSHNLEIIANTGVGLASIGASSAISGIEITAARIELSDVTSTGNQIYRATGPSMSDIQTNSTYTSAGGTITFDGTVQANDGLVINTTARGAAGGDVTFESALNSEANELNDVTITAGSGVINLNGLVGAVGILGSLKINSGVVNINGGGVSTAGEQIYTNDVNLGAASTLSVRGLSSQNINLSNYTLTVDESSNGMINGSVSGSGGLTKTGTGTLTLDNGSNSYSGGTTISAGTVTLTQNGSAGTGSITMGNAVLAAGADSLNIGNDIVLQSTGSQVATGDFDTTLSGAISGTGGLTKSGSGKLTLAQANSFAGGSTVNAGTLALLNNTAAGTGQITLGDAVLEAGADGLNVGNAIALNSSNSRMATGSFNTTLSGLVSGSGQLVKTGAGSLTLSGTNTYTGGTSVSAGTLALGTGTSAGRGRIALSSGTTLQANVAMALANAITVAGNSTIATGANAVTTSGVVSGSGRLIKTGTGALTLSGANTHTGGTTILAGTIVAASDTALGTGALQADGADVVLQAGKANLTLANAVTLSTDLIIDTAGELVLLNGEVSGSGKLIKRGTGILELAGNNSYTGGTTVEAGTLALDLDSAASTGEVIMAADTVVQADTSLALDNVFKLRGPVVFNTQGFDLVMNNTISNNSVGQLIKTGAGTLTLNGANDYSGGTIVQEGTLALYGTLASGVDVQSGATFGGTGTVAGDVSNAGTITPRLNGTRSTLTIVGNYVGESGTFASTLGGSSDAIVADQLAIQGVGKVASGSTTIAVSDPVGVLGRPTVGDGILLVSVTAGATSTSSAFTAPRIAAGAYEYTLVRGGESSSESWFLKADIDEPQPPVIITPEAAQREEVALYPSLPSLARQYLWSINGTLDDRRGAPDAIGQWSKQPIAWGRIIAQGNENKPGNVNNGPGLKSSDWGLQLGADLWRSDSTWGQWRVGPVATIGRSTGSAYNTTGSVKTGNVSLNAYSLGLNATVASHEGPYADLLLLGTRLTGVEANSPLGTAINTTGWAFSGSLEGGWRVPMSSKLAITPQAQVYVTTVNLNNAKDAYSLIEMPTQTTTVGRLGLKLSYDNITEHGQAQFWARASVFSTLSGKDASTSFLNVAGTNPTTFQSAAPSTWMAIDAAVNVQATQNTSVQVGLGYQTSFNSQYRGVYGQVNVRWAF